MHAAAARGPAAAVAGLLGLQQRLHVGVVVVVEQRQVAQDVLELGEGRGQFSLRLRTNCGHLIRNNSFINHTRVGRICHTVDFAIFDWNKRRHFLLGPVILFIGESCVDESLGGDLRHVLIGIFKEYFLTIIMLHEDGAWSCGCHL